MYLKPISLTIENLHILLLMFLKCETDFSDLQNVFLVLKPKHCLFKHRVNVFSR